MPYGLEYLENMDDQDNKDFQKFADVKRTKFRVDNRPNKKPDSKHIKTLKDEFINSSNKSDGLSDDEFDTLHDVK